MYQLGTVGGAMLLTNWEKSQYVLRVWFVYRYFCQNPWVLANERYKSFHKILDEYFMQKYGLETEEQTRKGIEELFKLESERPITINDEIINQLIDIYEKNPLLPNK